MLLIGAVYEQAITRRVARLIEVRDNTVKLQGVHYFDLDCDYGTPFVRSLDDFGLWQKLD